MSGVEVIGIILALYPVVADLAKTYKTIKGSGSSELNRAIFVAETIYVQTCRGLLESALSQEEVQQLMSGKGGGPIDQTLWADITIHQKLRARLGDEKLDVALDFLVEMRSSLDEVKTKLANMCRGTASGLLRQFRTAMKETVANMPQSEMRERLKHIRRLNDDLRALLDDMPFITPRQQFQQVSVQQSTSFITVSTSQQGERGAQDFFEAIKKTFSCACARAHVIGIGCYCVACSQPSAGDDPIHSANDWEFCLASPVEPEAPHDTISTTVLLESVPQTTTGASPIQNLCSLIRETAAKSESREVLIDTPNNGRVYRMKVTCCSTAPSIRYLAELVQPGRLSTRDKFELALRLSLAIAQLCKTPWVSGSWKCNDVCVTEAVAGDGRDYEDALKHAKSQGDSGSTKFPVVFILRQIYSIAYDDDTASQLTAVEATEVAQVLDDEPALTKLGLALIELVVGRSIQDMKVEYNLDAIDDDDLANLCTAKKMLNNGLIRNEASVMYERVVNACIKRQYIDNGGNPRSLLSAHASFLSCFREAILLPLFEVLKWYEKV